MGNNIIQARISIRGTRPHFWHRFTPDALPLEKQERSGVAGNDPEEWRKTCSFDRNGQAFVDPTYVFATIREGGRGIKQGKKSLMPAIASTLQVLDNKVMFDRHFPGFPNGHNFSPKDIDPPTQDSDEPIYLDIRGVRNPSTKARNVRYRIAASPGWNVSFTIEWDKTVVSRNEMESAIIEAGRLVGLGNGRSIGMGRFELTSFEIIEQANAA